MTCPYLKEVVMLYCDAYAVKKMVPLDRLVSTDPCLARAFHDCPVFRSTGAPDLPDPVTPEQPAAASEGTR